MIRGKSRNPRHSAIWHFGYFSDSLSCVFRDLPCLLARVIASYPNMCSCCFVRQISWVLNLLMIDTLASFISFIYSASFKKIKHALSHFLGSTSGSQVPTRFSRSLLSKSFVSSSMKICHKKRAYSCENA